MGSQDGHGAMWKHSLLVTKVLGGSVLRLSTTMLKGCRSRARSKLKLKKCESISLACTKPKLLRKILLNCFILAVDESEEKQKKVKWSKHQSCEKFTQLRS